LLSSYRKEKRLARLSDIRKAALALPGAREVMWHGKPGFNVGKKTFACSWGREERWIFKLPHAHQELLFEVRPEVFQPFRAGAMVWSYVDIDALTAKEVRELVTEAWTTIAPKKISKPFLESGPPAPSLHAPVRKKESAGSRRSASKPKRDR
jgi:hypothetical protein